MQARHILTVSVLAALVIGTAGPAFAAGWQAGGGQVEPSTEYDSDNYMFQEPNQDPVDKVYYNGFQIDGFLGNVDKNIEGGRTTGNLVQYGAYLGFWRDCNGDGYVGAKLTAEAYSAQYGHFSNGAYPADLYDVDTTTCPAGTAWNQGTFIDEFRWIGPNATYSQEELDEFDADRCQDNPYTVNETNPLTESEMNEDCGFHKDLYDVTDTDAVAWVDLSRPEQQAANTKPVFAKETLDNSSSTLYQTVGWLGVHNTVEGEISPPVPVDLDGDGEADTVTLIPEGTYDGLPNFGDCGGAERGEREFGGGPGFAGTGEGTCGYYPLWQAKRLVNDSESPNDDGAEPLVSVYETERDDDGSGSACDDTSLPGGFTMADVEPGVNDNPEMEGSIGGTIYRNVFYATNFNTAGNLTDMPLNGECRETTYPPSVLADASGAAGKFRVDTFLIYYPDSRLRELRDVGLDNVPTGAAGVFSGAAAPFTTSSKWLSFHVYIVLGAAGGTAPYWTAFYADVTDEAITGAGASAATALPMAMQDAHTYGGVECGGDFADTPENREANEFGWICSSAVWQEEANEFNGDAQPEEIDDRLRVIAGHPFDLRDVDCYDVRPFQSGEVDTNTGDVYVGVDGGETVTVRSTCGDGQLDPVVTAVNDAINST